MSLFRLLFVALTLLAIGCTPSDESSDKPLIVTSIRPLTLMVRDLVGDQVDVATLVPPGADPHSFALRVSDMQKLDAAELVIWLGPELERALEKALARVEADRQLRLSELQGIRWPPEVESHDHHGRDPHLWLSPQNSSLAMAAIAEQLNRLLPEHKAVIKNSLAAQQRQIEAFTAETHQQLQPFSAKGFAVHHDGYRHFVQAFGLNQLAAVSALPEDRLSAQQLSKLQRQLVGASCLLVDQVTPEAERLAKTLNLPLVAADPLAGDPELAGYSAFLQSLRDSFLSCLQMPSG